jgi:hypothetical protein
MSSRKKHRLRRSARARANRKLVAAYVRVVGEPVKDTPFDELSDELRESIRRAFMEDDRDGRKRAR